MESGNQRTAPRGIPGRLFVIPFSFVLAFLLWLVFSMAVRFQTIMTQLETTRAAWPAASNLFSARYAAIDAVGQQPEEWKEQFLDLRKQFLASTQFDSQSQVINRLEELIAKHREHVPNIGDLDSLQPELAKVRQLEKQRQTLQSDFVGKCTISGLRLKLPPVFLLQD
ncbi:MAG: hypothetical protein ACK56W_22370 [Pirellula sp.]|jgi:hypothetical protein